MFAKHEPAWRRYLRFWGPDNKSDIEDEFQFHLEVKTDELVAQGLSADEARRRAIREFGPIHTVQKECYAISLGRQERASRREYLAGWSRDVAYAFRMLRKSKASSVTAILILALGIGANTALFTILDRLLYRPLPVPKSSQLLLISTSSASKNDNSQTFSREGYIHLRDHNQTLSGLAAEAIMVSRERRSHLEIERPAVATAVSGNFFDVLGVRPALGRVLTSSDDIESDASHVAVASYRFWSRRFNQAPDALGSTIYLKDIPFTIVGLMPQGFFGLTKGSDPDLYVPLGALEGLLLYRQGLPDLRLIGRIKAGSSSTSAQSNLQAIWTPFVTADPKGAVGSQIVVHGGSSGYDGVSGDRLGSLKLTGAIVALLLLIGCANVACLMMARSAERHQEIAIRISLGAGKARVVRQSLLESFVLAGIGGLLGLVVAFWAERLLLIAFQWQERAIDLSLDWRVLAYTLGASLFTGLLFGLAPAAQCLRGGRLALNQEHTVAPFSSGKTLVVVEVALSLVMVAGAVVFIRSFQNLRSVPKGFQPENVSIVRLTPASNDDVILVAALARDAIRLTESLRATPTIESATVSDGATFNESTIGAPVTRPDAPEKSPISSFILRDQSYFDTLRMPLLSGRVFRAGDVDSSRRVAVIGDTAAQHLFPHMSPIGRIIRVAKSDDLEVVGVVNDIKFRNVRNPPPDLIYQPLRQESKLGAFFGTVKIHVRSRMSPSAVAAVVQDQIRQEHLLIGVDKASWLDDEIGATLLNDRVRMQASSLFGGLALLLITAGIYGLMAHSAVRRTREIGIRMAVGSSPAQIAQLMLKESARLILIGVILGVPGAIAVMKAVSGLVFGLPPIDGVSLAAAVVVLSVTGIAASLGPAWRAAHVDPVNALRLE